MEFNDEHLAEIESLKLKLRGIELDLMYKITGE